MQTVIYHSADYDGIFCREITKKFLGEKDVQYIGWNFGDPPVHLPVNGEFFIMDLPMDRIFGIKFSNGFVEWPDGKGQPLDRVDWGKITWIDHHKTSIDSHPTSIPGYRIDGVAACRLAWQWFATLNDSRNWIGLPSGIKAPLPTKQDFIDRKVAEPLAVRLAGEYDIWDKRDSRAETFQYALRCSNDYDESLQSLLCYAAETVVAEMLKQGEAAQHYAMRTDASICKSLTWLMEWEGLKWLCVNHARFNSNFFAAKDVPETGHDALLGFRFDGKSWMVSLYHAKHRTDLDLSLIAVKHGGGGHKGACGFTCEKLPFMT